MALFTQRSPRRTCILRRVLRLVAIRKNVKSQHKKRDEANCARLFSNCCSLWAYGFFLPKRPPSWLMVSAAPPLVPPASAPAALVIPPAPPLPTQENSDLSRLAAAPPMSGTNCGLAVVP